MVQAGAVSASRIELRHYSTSSEVLESSHDRARQTLKLARHPKTDVSIVNIRVDFGICISLNILVTR